MTLAKGAVGIRSKACCGTDSNLNGKLNGGRVEATLILKKRRLGRMGWNGSILTLGGCGLGELTQDRADSSVKLALRYGVNVVDVAPSYGRAELRLAPWIRRYRRKFFLAEKTMKRTREGAWSELHRSLKRLGTETFDLYQLHAVGELREVKTIFGRNGALRALREAKETGLVKNLGITGHKDMRVLSSAIERFDFDSVLLPVNLASMAKPSPENDYRPILRLAIERDMSVTAIKAISKGRWRKGSRQKYQTWYEPVDTETEIRHAISFTLSQDPVATYSIPCDVRLWPSVLEAGLKFKRLGDKEQMNLILRARETGFNSLFPHRGEYSRE